MNTYHLALIGDPVMHSNSDQYHNYLLSHLGLKERYGKFDISEELLASFLVKAKNGGMKGLSVTMPLKGCIIPLLDHIDDNAKQIGAVNTIKFSDGEVWGYNTDITGALKAIKYCYHKSLAAKKAIVVGAGGVAKAIVLGLLNAGMKVVVLNRTKEKSLNLAKRFSVDVQELKSLKTLLVSQCDFLIQATSVGMFTEEKIIEVTDIPKHVIVFDVISSPKNQWLEQLSQRGSVTISGKLFWIFQAIEQYKIWYDNQVDLSAAFSILRESHKFE